MALKLERNSVAFGSLEAAALGALGESMVGREAALPATAGKQPAASSSQQEELDGRAPEGC